MTTVSSKAIFVILLMFGMASSVAAEWFDGGDVSTLPVLEAHGAIFQAVDDKSGDVIHIMRTAGANCFRLRLFVEPSGKNTLTNDLTYTLRLAQRVKESGATLMLSFHYSDIWANPEHQSVPKPWSNLTGSVLAQRVEDYTAATLRVFGSAGVLPDLVQVGNEINHGMLWPYGKLNGADEDAWNRFAALLKAGVRGVRKATPPGKHIRIVLHSASAGSIDGTRAFLQNLQKHGVDYDVLGLSYYPWWSGSVDRLRQNIHQIAGEFQKEVLIAETAYPWRSPDRNSPLNPGKGVWTSWAWPPTPEGQMQFLRDVETAVAAAPQGRGLGVLWWHPESVYMRGVNNDFQGNTALFDSQGRALPALRVLADH